MNKVIVVGNLTRDPELITTNSGVSMCRFTIAVQRRYAAADGNRETDFITVVVWRAQADNCYKYLKKGSKAGVVGSMQTRNYETTDGQKRYVTEVVAEEVEFISTKGSEEGREASSSEESGKKNVVDEFEPIDDGDLPF